LVEKCIYIDDESETLERKIFLKFSVKDCGVGMSEEDVTSLFNLYGKLNRHQEMSRTSCGLGLVISKALCKELGGDILVSSVLGEGSTFYFYVQ
jgi:signal transduction histidine kinase